MKPLLCAALAATLLCGCGAVSRAPAQDACSAGEATYACQVQRYQHADD